MAVVFWSKGEHDRALAWYQRALVGWENALGKDHPQILSALYKGYTEWCQETFHGREKTLGEDHPDAISTANSIAILSELSNGATPPTPGPHRETRMWSWALSLIPRIRSPWVAQEPNPA